VSGEIAARLAAVRERIGRAARRAGRSPEEVALVGIAKQKPSEAIVEAVRAGLARVGESYVQEARAKRPRLEAELAAAGVAPPRWHFVGRLQTNKTRDAAELFDVVESVDRERLGADLSRRAEQAGRRLDVLLQANLSGEPQKGGADPAELPALLAASRSWPALRVIGLMTVPAASDDPEASRPAFARLRELRDALHGEAGGVSLRELSMGMSADFEVAVEEGATWVRVGAAIFGPREET
jgi:pyridoxal phosphate enzyme (YggS family)